MQKQFFGCTFRDFGRFLVLKTASFFHIIPVLDAERELTGPCKDFWKRSQVLKRLPEVLACLGKTAGSARARSGLWISATFPVKQKANLAARLLPTNDLYVCRYMQNCFCTYTSTLYNKFFEIAPIFLIFSNSNFLTLHAAGRNEAGRGLPCQAATRRALFALPGDARWPAALFAMPGRNEAERCLLCQAAQKGLRLLVTTIYRIVAGYRRAQSRTRMNCSSAVRHGYQKLLICAGMVRCACRSEMSARN